jgi:hypothetical protein
LPIFDPALFERLVFDWSEPCLSWANVVRAITKSPLQPLSWHGGRLWARVLLAVSPRKTHHPANRDRAVTIMQYRLVYDVMNDSELPWFGLALIVILSLLSIVCILEIIARIRAKWPVPTPGDSGRAAVGLKPLSFVIMIFLVLVSAVVFIASETYQGYIQRQRCQEWSRTGQYQVTEGTIANYQFRKAGVRFSVTGLTFDTLERSVGFTGRFNVPTVTPDSLQEGMRVRLAHHEGYILRLEIASEPVIVDAPRN